jgi:hypothetical protein
VLVPQALQALQAPQAPQAPQARGAVELSASISTRTPPKYIGLNDHGRLLQTSNPTKHGKYGKVVGKCLIQTSLFQFCSMSCTATLNISQPGPISNLCNLVQPDALTLANGQSEVVTGSTLTESLVGINVNSESTSQIRARTNPLPAARVNQIRGWSVCFSGLQRLQRSKEKCPPPLAHGKSVGC